MPKTSSPSSLSSSHLFTIHNSTIPLPKGPFAQKEEPQTPPSLRKMPLRSFQLGTRRPVCTHMYMYRLYGDHVCFICGKTPSVGWVYACHQDSELRRLQEASLSDSGSVDIVQDENNYFDVMAILAQSLKMSASIVSQICAGHYSLHQIDLLIAQKEHLHATIRKAEVSAGEDAPPSLKQVLRSHEPDSGNINATARSESSPIGVSRPPSSMPPMAPSENAAQFPAQSMNSSQRQSCCFQACHTCRPQFHERATQSLWSILAGEVPTLQEREITRLRVLNAKLLCDIGNRGPLPTLPSGPTGDNQGTAGFHQADGLEDQSSDWTTMSLTVSESDSGSDELRFCLESDRSPVFNEDSAPSCKSVLDDNIPTVTHAFEPHRDLFRMTPENSISSFCTLHIGTGNTPGASSTASSISLPTPSTLPRKRARFDSGKQSDSGYTGECCKSNEAAPVCGILTDHGDGSYFQDRSKQGSSDSIGSEVEVEGGVALTEEAVNCGMPDIVTDH